MKTTDIAAGLEYAIDSGQLFTPLGFSSPLRARVIDARYTYKPGDFGPGYYRGAKKGVLIETLVTLFDGSKRLERRVVRPQDVKATWSQYLAMKQRRDVEREAERARVAEDGKRADEARADWHKNRDDVVAAFKAAGVDGYIATGFSAGDAVTLTSEQAIALAAALGAAKAAA